MPTGSGDKGNDMPASGDETARLALDGLQPLRDVIELHGLAAKKSLGQNFILDLNLTDKIARATGDITGRLIVEVGPGPGGLTRSLLAAGAGHVVAVERDDRCLGALASIADRWPGRLTVIGEDALSVDWGVVLAPHRAAAGRPARIIANLPYGVATRLLVGWLETEPWPPWFDGMALMFQREVADRIVAEPSTKPYGRLSVISQWRCDCRIAFTLPPRVFHPPPKVESAVVSFVPRAELSPPCNVRRLGEVTQAIFGQRRKMLRATLKTLHPAPEFLLGQMGIDGTRRGESLTVEEICRLAVALGGGATGTS